MTGVVADPQMWSGSVSWSGMGGRLRVGAAYDAHKDFTTAGQTDKGFRVTGGWNFGFADIGAAYEEMTYKTAAGDATPCSGASPLPFRSAKVQSADPTLRRKVSRLAGVETPTGAKQWNLGYDYRFSKRTTVGFGYATIDNEAGAVFTWSGLSSTQGGQSVNPPAGSDVEIFFINMLHRF